MKLKCQKKNIIYVYYSDLQEYIYHIYNKEFDIPCDQESSNDSSINVHVRKKPISPYEYKSIEIFIDTGKHSFLLHSIMNYMCNEGHLQEGDYNIEICW